MENVWKMNIKLGSLGKWRDIKWVATREEYNPADAHTSAIGNDNGWLTIVKITNLIEIADSARYKEMRTGGIEPREKILVVSITGTESGHWKADSLCLITRLHYWRLQATTVEINDDSERFTRLSQLTNNVNDCFRTGCHLNQSDLHWFLKVSFSI